MSRGYTRVLRNAFLVIVTVSMSCRVALAIPAFPGAEGFGANATGGRGGEVFHVVNTLNTNAGSYEGPNGYNRGTLRWCLLSEVSSLPRTIVFETSGSVTLSSQITVENSNITLAGQTAPGQGFSTTGRPWLFESGNDLVMRYIRNRTGRNGGQDSIGVEGGTNIIFDHVSSSWSNDEALSVAKDGNLITVQHSLIYEGLNHSGHGYGSLIRPDIDSKVTYHHNLYANNESRNPRPGTYNNRKLEFDFRNNVIYNWGDRAGYTGGSEGSTPEPVDMNFVGNYTIAGPSTQNNWTSAFITSTNASLRAYQLGNLIDSDLDSMRDGVDTGWNMFEVEAGSLTQMPAPFAFSGVPVTSESAAEAYENVLNYAGAHWWNRDSADARVVNQVRTQTGSIIDLESEVGGAPAIPVVMRDIATWDSDYDGMPNFWEIVHGLNPNASIDRNSDFDNDGYTNLEEYINEVGAWPAPRAITWNGGSGRYALNQNWDTWQPSHFDEVRINSGTATVDAIGQHARAVKIGTEASDSSVLSITNGWLMVEEDVVIGADPAATATLNLGGGTLRAQRLSKGAGGTFNFTGGRLEAEVVEFDLVNNGGTLAPGNSPGMTQVLGELSLNGGVLEIEIGGSENSAQDVVLVNGLARLGGTLSVKLLDLGEGVFAPQQGDLFGFLVSAGTEGMFDQFDLPELAPGLGWSLHFGDATTFLAVVLAGDYNNDGHVDAADYVVWRNFAGTDAPLINETASLGTVDVADYNAWRANFGASLFDGSAANVPTPESATLATLLVGITLLTFGRFHAKRSRMNGVSIAA